MSSKILAVPATLLLVSLGQTSLLAATILYTADSFSDGVSGTIVGGADSVFELYGIGYTQTDTTFYVGLNTNLPIGGSPDASADGGSVTWGDLFFNFSAQPFAEAVTEGQVYGVRFDAANDSPLPQLGLYQVQQTTSVTPINTGFASLADYQSVVTEAGGIPSLGSIPINGGYLSNTGLPQNVIAEGILLSEDVNFIEDFSSVGFAPDFGFSSSLSQTGNFTYGFSIDRAALPTGDFIAHLLAECANDGVAFAGTLLAQEISPISEPESVPEPTTWLACFGLGIAYGARELFSLNKIFKG